MDKYYLPKSLDEPFKIYLLTADEFLALTVPVIILGFVLNQMVFSLMIGLGGLFLLKKFKGEQGHFYLLHLAYWYLPAIVRFKATPPSYVREYLG